MAILTEEDEGRRRVAAYLGKYATKGIEPNGVLTHRLRGGLLDSLKLPAHLRRLVEATLELGEVGAHNRLRLRAWAHTAGFRGHFLTKSRRFSAHLEPCGPQGKRGRRLRVSQTEALRKLSSELILVVSTAGGSSSVSATPRPETHGWPSRSPKTRGRLAALSSRRDGGCLGRQRDGEAPAHSRRGW